MAKDLKIVRRAFNAGEVSKLFKFRNDVEKHAYSCETLENFYVSPLGGIYRRNGTKLLEVIGADSAISAIRIVPFDYNRSAAYLLVFYAATNAEYLSMKVVSVSGAEVIAAETTPIKTAYAQEFQYRQVNGWVYFVHTKMPPQRLVVNANMTCAWEDAVSIYPSFDEKENATITLASGGSNSDEMIFKGTEIAATSSAAFFTSDMVGAQIKFEYTDSHTQNYIWHYETGSGSGSGSGNGLQSHVSGIFPASGEVHLRPQGGVWDGTLKLEESTDNGATWGEIGRTSSVQGSDNTELVREVYDVGSIVRANLSDQKEVVAVEGQTIDEASEGCKFSIFSSGTCTCWAEITAISNSTHATLKVLNPTRTGITSRAVYKSAWGKEVDYPRTVEVHEERLTLGGTTRFPSTVWLSQTNKWDNFRSVSNLETDPLSYTLATNTGEPISWVISKEDLMIGIGDCEWSLGTRDSSKALSSSIVQASNQSDDGVEYIMPAKAGGMLVFVRRGNRELASIAYDYVNDSYNAISLTTMNPEILKGGVVEIFNQLSPSNKIYAVRNDGQVGVFTYDKENNVAAWSRFIFGAGVKSACALSTGDFKSVFLVVKRNGFLCLERLDPNESDNGNWRDCVPYSNSVVVPSGLLVSVSYTSKLRTTPIFTEGNVKVYDARFYMLDSFGGQCRVVGIDQNGDDFAEDWEQIRPRESELFSTPDARDYRYTKNCDTDNLEEAALEIKTDVPAPFTLCALGLKAKGN